MARVYFHCSHEDLLLADCCEAEVDGLTAARDHATMVVQSLVARSGPEDWRAWVVHVSDDLGQEILAMPFSSVMGRLH